jgi:UDP-GlcNAc3NAcA epimerase
MEALLDSDLLLKIKNSATILIIPPAGFLDIIALEKNARIIISDSGGLQKESFFFQKPCVILREQTEWIEIVENGNALLAGSDFQKIIDSFNLLYNKTNYSYPAFYGDGDAASFICQKIVEDL